ncbi:homoserine kinase [Nostocoides sp. F2B08]|uniref:homoserine kinase n=1 Tax=Nostocoides sp. F2B08 TaxID=2653936 RepID=UPI0012638F90|nr:homoserine kinase [Tetrasphaera sp. F2B08]KAB7746169.1 homoserine kinase [Tetrasphaera sp. F2B08]
MEAETVIVRVPASSANLGPGFDSVGLALGVWDECSVSVTDEPGLRIEVAGAGAGEVPLDESHLVYRTMLHTWSVLGADPPSGLELRCHNAVPHGRGMGSSATAIVSGIVAAQAVLGLRDGAARGVDLAVANDIAAALEGHPDNSSASVYGGLTLSWTDDGDDERTRTVRAPIHDELDVVVLVPAGQLSTAKARSVLPAQVRLGDAARNSARAALLVHALGHDPSLLLPATREWLHQEPRRPAYPSSMALVDRMRSAGHAAVISGAGPSVLVLTTRDTAASVAGLADEDWTVLRPGIPREGASVTRVPTHGLSRSDRA